MSVPSALFPSLAVVTGVPFLAVSALAASPARLPRLLPMLVSFGGGALLGAAFFHLLPDAYGAGRPLGFVSLAVVGGLVGSYLLEKALHRLQRTPHEAPPQPGDAISAFDDSSMVALNFLSDALHNFVDGVLITAAFLAGEVSGVVTATAMLLHELPRELGTFGVFVHYGTRPWRAAAYNLASGALAFAGAALVLVLGGHLAGFAAAMTPVAAGMFLFIGSTVMVSQLKVLRAWELPVTQLTACCAGLGISALAAAWH